VVGCTAQVRREVSVSKTSNPVKSPQAHGLSFSPQHLSPTVNCYPPPFIIHLFVVTNLPSSKSQPRDRVPNRKAYHPKTTHVACNYMYKKQKKKAKVPAQRVVRHSLCVQAIVIKRRSGNTNSPAAPCPSANVGIFKSKTPAESSLRSCGALWYTVFIVWWCRIRVIGPNRGRC